ncbi:MAG: PD40 domain-containing protein [Bacteroidales bacterium]|nr:PD40 domain-containing protein [Bacteroidales bacterium]
MRRAKYILCLIFVITAVSLAGQSRSDLREMFVSAEGDLLFEEYAEALPKYLSLLQIYPENYNLYCRIGQCYLNTPGEKDKAITWLETAVQHINPGYRRGRLRETGAPYDALYFLANAYRIGTHFDKALDTYELFLREVDTETYDIELVRFQMQTCQNARQMMRKPVLVVDRNVGSPINSRFSEFNPVISSDEKTLLFTRGLQFYDAVFWSTCENGVWSEPENLNPKLGIDQDYYPSSLSHDGRTMLLYRIDTYDGNIYQSRFEGDSWSNVTKLNNNINTKYWESHATMTRDGRRIYFTSNRRESIGGLDIFMSERDSTGDWGPAVNLGPEINTVYNEETPFLANDDRTLFFSSRGHFNIGGYDIFRSDLGADGRWSTPVNIGYPVNTPDDDLFFIPVGKGDRGYYSRFDDEGYGRLDLFSCDIYSERNPRNFIVTGRASVSNLLDEFPQPVKVTAVSNADAARMISALTNPVTGIYSFRLPQGAYRFTFDSDDALTLSQNHEMPVSYGSDTVRIEPVVLKETDFSARLRLLSDTILKVSSPEPVNISLIAEERSLLDVGVLPPDSLLTVEQFRITDSTFTYTFLPEEGESTISFRLTDRFGNDTGAVVRVTRHDVSEQSGKPLYTKIPSRPVGEVADDAKTVEPVATRDSSVISAGLSDNEILKADEAGAKGGCRLWWLLIVAAPIIFFFIWKRSKSNRNEKE